MRSVQCEPRWHRHGWTVLTSLLQSMRRRLSTEVVGCGLPLLHTTEALLQSMLFLKPTRKCSLTTLTRMGVLLQSMLFLKPSCQYSSTKLTRQFFAADLLTAIAGKSATSYRTYTPSHLVTSAVSLISPQDHGRGHTGEIIWLIAGMPSKSLGLE